MSIRANYNLHSFLRILARIIRRLNCFVTVAKLKAIGIDISWSARVHPLAVIEPSGGRIKIGDRTYIDHGAILRAMEGHIVIGSDCSINAYSFLSGAGGLIIEDQVMIGSHVSIYASNHIYANSSMSICSQGLSKRGIKIERDVWVGTGVKILDGIVVGTGSVLAAGAVITKSTTSYSINAGVPSRPIGSRYDSSSISPSRDQL